ncbi:Reducing polyketide synthase hmp8 [Colletotrichum gloeosporioides]|uniref:Reducing polyketide synthase hmp8 n=1 Tax=Colletotrichum gloeosporioides TaxID=474922 RepID=A0A8H4CL88_COLGL|nr:Reducing polyketide synthase hmp8 [Colletotrichum gloeosporioides]KAF3805846.1 Reducing polyketide synthase hmp8 [Colletotrichum gloeosporioides]
MTTIRLVLMYFFGQKDNGVVIKTGSQASRLKPGDCVSFLGVGTHTTKIQVDHRVVAHLPDAITFEEAADLLVVHTTAYHALANLAKLTKAKLVLIQAVTGSVAQIAVWIAFHLDMSVHVTVGWENKRRLLANTHNLLKKHRFNSRDASFIKSKCLATLGTFVEIGLCNILNDTRLDTKQFGKSTAFKFFNKFTLYEEDAAALRQDLNETFKLESLALLIMSSILT